MLSDADFIIKSLELNLFFARIAKEHSFFIEVAIPSKNSNYIQEAEMFKNEYARLLMETVRLADGVLPKEFLAAGEIVTDMTLAAEKASEFYSGYTLNTEITKAELSLGRNRTNDINPQLIIPVTRLNQQAMVLTSGLIRFKSRLLKEELTCRIFTFNYPLLLEHILREAQFYLGMLTGIQNRKIDNSAIDLIHQEIFWNRIMAEHAKFIRGLLDPTEEKLFNTADNFGREFDALTVQAQKLLKRTTELPTVTRDTRQATVAIRDFKRQGTKGLITCKIKSIAHPLLGDHIVREANHYLRLLNLFESGIDQ